MVASTGTLYSCYVIFDDCLAHVLLYCLMCDNNCNVCNLLRNWYNMIDERAKTYLYEKNIKINIMRKKKKKNDNDLNKFFYSRRALNVHVKPYSFINL